MNSKDVDIFVTDPFCNMFRTMSIYPLYFDLISFLTNFIVDKRAT